MWCGVVGVWVEVEWSEGWYVIAWCVGGNGVAVLSLAWHGVAWRGVAWRGVAWRGVVWCG